MTKKIEGTGSCRVCGCTETDCRRCIDRDGHPCHWVEADLCSSCSDRSPAYLAGFDCGKNGSNETNCHFSLFDSPQRTKEWEAGKRDAEKIFKMPKGLADDLICVMKAMEKIKKKAEGAGYIECPKCKGELIFSKASSNGHVRAKCKTAGCLQFME